MLLLANALGDISLALRSIADLDPTGKGPGVGGALDKPKEGNAVRLMRYGVRSRATSVN
jgi:pilus assembly protein CpaB